MREEKNKENTQIGRLYTNLTFDNGATPLPFFSRLFFICCTPPLSFPHSAAVIPAPPAVIPAVFKRESILDYADVNPASANWIPA